MNNTTEATHQNGENQPVAVRTVRMDALRQTQEQIATLLAVTQTLGGFLLPGQDGTLAQEKLDDETFTSCQASFMRTCNRLDLILDDDTRWSVAEAETLEKAMTEMAEAQRDTARAAAEHARNLVRPSVTLNAKVRKLQDGSFLVFIGELNAAGTIYGTGDTLEEAMTAFDKAAGGKIAENKPTPKLKKPIVPPEQRTNRKPPTDEQP